MPETPTKQVGQTADEVALVASLITEPWQYAQIHTWLTPEDFTRDDMRAIYLAIAELTNEGSRWTR